VTINNDDDHADETIDCTETTDPDDLDGDLITATEAGVVAGGDGAPISLSTVYRNVQRGIYSPPVHPSPGVSRFRRSTLLKDIAREIARHGAGK
jgi:hypothetical protein